MTKQTTYFKNEQMIWIVISPNKVYGWEANSGKDAQHHWLLRKYELDLQWDIIIHLLEWLKLKLLILPSFGESVEEQELSYNRECKRIKPLQNIIWQSLKVEIYIYHFGPMYLTNI